MCSANGDAGTGAVDSFKGREGAVIPVVGDYAASQLDNDSDVDGQYVADALNYISGKIVSVVEYGAIGDGVADDTAAFQAALGANDGLFIPSGTYLVSNIGMLAAAGKRIIGESRFKTHLKVKAGTTGAVFYSQNAAGGTSGLHHIQNLFVDLNGQDVIAFDFGSIGTTVIDGCRVVGGTSFATAIGTGVKLHAPIAVGAYSNALRDCDFTFLATGVSFGDGGNHNNIYGGEFISCTIGIDASPATGTVDTVKIFGCRFEGCGTGLREGASFGSYFGLRFENQSTADVDFTTKSDHPSFFWRVHGGISSRHQKYSQL